MQPYLALAFEALGLFLILFIYYRTSRKLQVRLEIMKNAVQVDDAAQAFARANFALGVMLTIIVVTMVHNWL